MCRGGEIGRRTALRGQRERSHRGSSPLLGTIVCGNDCACFDCGSDCVSFDCVSFEEFCYEFQSKTLIFIAIYVVGLGNNCWVLFFICD